MWRYSLIYMKIFGILNISLSLRSININSNNSTYTSAANLSVPCKNNSDCNFGECNNKSLICECNYRFVNYESNRTVIPCSYELKKQYDTFILELIVGFGAGQFYSARYVHGVLKLFAYLFGILSICLFPFTLNKLYSKVCTHLVAFGISVFYCGYAIGFAVWYIYDLVMIRNNSYLDGNGFPLQTW
jgi:hypothetical protein